MNSNIEFSRAIQIDNAKLGKKFHIEATEDELNKIATRFGLHRINYLKLQYIIATRDSIPNAYNLICHMDAKVVKFIIEDSEETLIIDEDFDIVLLDEISLKSYSEILKNEDIELIDNNMLFDIGEIAAQYLSLFVYM